jgi:hypothetical protein
MQNPQYTVVPIDLSTAGKMTINQAGDVLHVAEVLNGSALALDVPVKVQPIYEGGGSEDDAINLYMGNRIRASSRSFVVLWDAHAGHTARLVLTRGVQAIDLDTTPPVRLQAGAAGGSIAQAAVSVGTTATLLSAANASRKSVVLQNLGSSPVYLGGASVTTANGVEIAGGGGAIVVDKTTAALYGIVSAGTSDVRVLTES